MSCQKVPKFDFQSQFSMSKFIRIFLKFLFIEKYQFRSTFFCYIFLTRSILNNFITNMMPYFWQLAINPRLKTLQLRVLPCFTISIAYSFVKLCTQSPTIHRNKNRMQSKWYLRTLKYTNYFESRKNSLTTSSIRGRSLTMLTKLCLFLTTYLTLVETVMSKTYE